MYVDSIRAILSQDLLLLGLFDLSLCMRGKITRVVLGLYESEAAQRT